MKPLIKIFSIFVIVIITCQICVGIINKGYRKYNVRFTELFESNTNYNILFLGSSRIAAHMNPKVVDSICHSNSYNAGIEGGNLFEFKITFDAYLQKHPVPEFLVLNVDLTSFGKGYFFNYNQYYPYLNNSAIRNALIDKGYYNFFYKLFPFLIITEYDNLTRGNAINGLRGRDQGQMPNGDFLYKGYKTNGYSFITTADTITDNKKLDITISGLTDLQSIIKTCKEKKIKLIITYAPEYNFGLQRHVKNAQHILKVITQIAAENNIKYYRDDSLELCRNPRLFFNLGHLNTSGAKDYSAIMANRLMQFKQVPQNFLY